MHSRITKFQPGNLSKTRSLVSRPPVCFSSIGINQTTHLPRSKPWTLRSEWPGTSAITRDPDTHISLQSEEIGMIELSMIKTPRLELVRFIPEQGCSATVN